MEEEAEEFFKQEVEVKKGEEEKEDFRKAEEKTPVKREVGAENGKA